MNSSTKHFSILIQSLHTHNAGRLTCIYAHTHAHTDQFTSYYIKSKEQNIK